MKKFTVRKTKPTNVKVIFTIRDKNVHLDVTLPSKWIIIVISTLATIFGYPRIVELVIKLLEYK